ncbi:MAG TPA: DUF4019 domain-containing protein [Armatimonadota bacterium]|nr:DUF4019 domain-containing protein [Armatimonadota bacterium]
MRTHVWLALMATVLMCVGCAKESAETPGPTPTTAAAPTADDDHAAAKAEAVEAAEAWLALIDDDEIDESWDQAAEAVQQAVTKDAWAQQMKAVRGQVGALKERKVRTTQYAVDIPGAPEGEYVVILFDASYENGDVVETVTPMKTSDGTWLVSGYFMK